MLLIFVGATHFHSAELHPFLSHGTSGVFTASSYLFIAFLGFNVITSISGDIDNPRKTIPRAILLSMLIVTIVYVGVVIALLSANIHTYNEASVGQAAQNLIGPIGGGLVVVGALIATLSAANSNILGSSEIMVRLAVRKQVPTIFGHLTNGHPYVSVLFGALFYVILLMTRQTEAIIHLANFTAIIALIIVNVAAIRLFRTKKLVRLIPILGILGAAGQLVFLPKVVILIGSFLIIVGMSVYTVRKKYFIPHLHSKLETTIKRQKSPLGRALKHR